MSAPSSFDQTQSAAHRLTAVVVWLLLALLFAVPVVCESLALEAGGDQDRSALLVLLALAITAVGGVVLVASWQRIVRSVGNEGLATIASIASLQFLVSYASRLVGSVAATALGPLYVFVDGLGSKGLSCLFLGVLVALLPRPGVLTLALLTLFALNVITSGQVGLTALVFVTVSIALHESLAALCGVTIAGPRSIREARTPWQFVLGAGLAIGLANACALYTQYALYEVLLRLYFDTWYKLSVSIVTGLLFGGSGAACGVILGLRLRKVAP